MNLQELQVIATLALAAFAATQGVGMWFRAFVALKQLRLDAEKHQYRKQRDSQRDKK
jgi:hypothetical protein